MNKRVYVSVALSITLIAMAVTFAITWLVSRDIFEQTVNSVTQRQRFYDKLGELDNYVRSNFYGTIDDDYMNDRMGQGYINGLNDPNSAYYTEREFLEMMDIQDGVVVDVGLEIVKAPGGFRIVKVYPGSPAEIAAVPVGSLLVAVDGESVTGLTSARPVRASLRGQPETEVTITCLDPTGVTEKSYILRRVQFYTPTVVWQMVDGYAYMHISTITPRTATEFNNAVRQVLSENAKGFIIDVRGNTGGLIQSSSLEQVFDMVDLLCPRGTIASAGLKSNASKVLATSGEDAVEQPIVVLVNGSTGSAAELFAAALRSLGGAEVVGVKTAGRGMLQRAPKVMSDGSAVSVTYARLLYGPSQEDSFNEVGVLPDIEVVYENESDTSLINPDFKTDVVILRGLERVKTMARAKGLETSNLPASSTSQDASASGSTSGGESGAESQSGGSSSEDASKAESASSTSAASAG